MADRREKLDLLRRCSAGIDPPGGGGKVAAASRGRGRGRELEVEPPVRTGNKTKIETSHIRVIFLKFGLAAILGSIKF
jgi:hypothetical protein